MKKLALVLVGALIFVLGCGAQESAENAADAAKSAVEGATEAAQSMSDKVSAEPVTLVGTTGCGHCNFGKGTGCSAALQTADGTIYLLDGVDQDSDLFQQRTEGKSVKVTGPVTEADGELHMALVSHEWM